MKRKVMVIAGAVIIALLLAAPVFAQDRQQTVETTTKSNTNRATMGYFKTDVDNYMNYHSFGKVAFDQYFGFAGVGIGSGSGIANNQSSIIQAGYATNVGGLYLGLLYDGSIANKQEGRKETLVSTFNADNGELEAISTTVNYTNSRLRTDNGIAGIIGIGTMGIKFGFYEYTDVFQNPTNTNIVVRENGDETTYESKVVDFENHNNTFVPYLGFGMSLDMGGMAIKPYVNVHFAINSIVQNEVFTDYTEAYGEYGERVLTSAGNAASYLEPNIEAGANISMGKLGFGIGYKIIFDIMNNDYDVYGISGDVKGRASWNNASITENYGPIYDSYSRTAKIMMYEEKYMEHTISPSVTYDIVLNDTVAAGFGLKLPVTITSNTTGEKAIEYTKTEVTYHNNPTGSYDYYEEVASYSGETSTSTFGIAPELYFGARANAVPNRLAVNAGISIKPLVYTRSNALTKPNGYTTTTTTQTTDGVLTTDISSSDLSSMVDDVLETTKTWSWLSANIGAGMCFSFTPSFALDLAYLAVADNFTLSTTGVRVLFSIKN